MQPRSRVNTVVLTTERYLEGISKLDKGMPKEVNNVSNPAGSDNHYFDKYKQPPDADNDWNS